jgi:hypothetical protein
VLVTRPNALDVMFMFATSRLSMVNRLENATSSRTRDAAKPIETAVVSSESR